MIVNQANLRGLDVSYSAAYRKGFDEVVPAWQRLASTIPSSSRENTYTWLGQMPTMREWIGEREIQNLSAYRYSIENRKFELTISVPRDVIEDDQYGTYSLGFQNMGHQAARHPADLVFEVIMKGFNGICYDGKPFFADDHPVGEGKDKKTYSNKGTAELSAESFEEARVGMMSLRGDKGKSLNIVPDLLVVSPKYEKTARLILEADQINGTTNVNKGLAEIMVSTELAEHPDYWFLLDTKRPLKPFIFQERKKIKFVSKIRETDDNVFMHDEFIYGCDGRSNAGYGFWQMAYGSTGETKAQG